jgi:hypothetical protein
MVWAGDDGGAKISRADACADRRRFTWRVAAGVAVALSVGTPACRQDADLAGRRIPHVTVKTVTDQGVVLDQSATPRQVAYVFLKAVRDDVQATTAEAREAALRRQLDLCAPDAIFRRYHDFHQRSAPGYETNRDETVYRVVDSWAPTLAHYVDNLEFDWPRAQTVLHLHNVRKRPEGEPDLKRVWLEVADPGGDPNTAAVVQLTLVEEGGFWRMLNVGFVAGKRHLGPTTSAPATGPTGPSQAK